jgi:Tfp pilus assembly protein PilX
MLYKTTTLRREDGAVLVIGILTLVILTIIGIAATTTSRIESDIAKNDNIYKKGFYAGELATSTGENVVTALPNRIAFEEDTIPGHYARNDASKPAWNDPLLWDDTHSAIVPLNKVPEGIKDAVDASSLPRYVIQDRDFIRDSFAIGIGRSTGIYHWTITSRGLTRGSQGAHVFIETIYATRYD